MWSISTVDKDSPTWKYGRYRIDRQFQQKIGRNRPSMWIHTQKKSVHIDRRRALIPKKNRSTVDIDCQSGHGLKKIVNIDLTHPYFMTKRCILLTRTLTSVDPDQFQALLAKQHTRKKQTHWQSVRWTQSQEYFKEELIWRKNYLVNTPAFWVPPLTCACSCDASTLGLWARPRSSEKSGKKGPLTYGPIWSHKWWEMVPDTHLHKSHGHMGGQKCS